MTRHTTRINGGHHGYRDAVDMGFRSNCINPVLRYSPTRGFHVESKVHPPDEDVVWQEILYRYDPKDGRHRPSTVRSRSGSYHEYQVVRAEILQEINADIQTPGQSTPNPYLQYQ